MAAQIDAVLARLKERGNFGAVERIDYTHAVSADDLLAEAEAVGMFRSPRFVIDAPLRFAYENIAKWVVGDPTMKCVNPRTMHVEAGDLTKGVYLAGRTGCGKTWALEIFAFLAKEHGFKYTAYREEQRMVMEDYRADEITADYMKEGDDSVFTDGVKVLVVNDLGTEPCEVMYMGNRVDVMRQILEKRADNPARITLITSNIPMQGDALRKRYGDRVASRLVQMCNYIEIKGDDKRV
jgi:hypothetical protein